MPLEQNDIAGAAEPPRKNPCGSVCCKAEPTDWTPTSEPKVRLTPEERANFSTEALQAYDDRCRERDRVTCYHESAHAILAAIEHQTIKFVQAGVAGTSFIRYGGERRESDAMIYFGGPIGDGIARKRIPYSSPEEARFYLDKARGPDCGDCDLCKAAACLIKFNPDADDDALVEKWRQHWQRAVELLDTLNGRIILTRLATALQEKRHLAGDAVNEILGDVWATVVWEHVLDKHCS